MLLLYTYVPCVHVLVFSFVIVVFAAAYFLCGTGSTKIWPWRLLPRATTTTMSRHGPLEHLQLAAGCCRAVFGGSQDGNVVYLFMFLDIHVRMCS